MTLVNKNYNIAILLIFILLIPKSYCNNLTAYYYFQGMIDKSNVKLETLLNGENTTPIQANIFNISKDLKEYGINVTILNISPIFREFFVSTNNIIINYNNMIEYRDILNPDNYIVFKTSLRNVENNLKVLNQSIQKIDKIKLKYKNETLRFNTTDIKKTINKLNSKLKLYTIKLNSISPKGFIIYSNQTVIFIGSNITIYGYIDIKKPINITIFYDNTSYITKSINGMFSKSFTINKIGNHIFYAKYGNRTSNILKIRCIRIPTYFDIKYDKETYVLFPAKVKVHLYDIYGNEIKSFIYVFYKNKGMMLKTPCVLYINETSKKILPIEFIYFGNNIYSPTKKIIYINFIKIPTYIEAKYEDNKIVGYLKDFNGNGLNNKTIFLILDNRTYYATKTYINGSFVFLLNNSLSSNECKVLFKGDSIYKPSEKTIKITSGLTFYDYIIVTLFITILLTASLISNKIKIQSKDSINDETNINEKAKKIDIYNIFINFLKNKQYFDGIVKAYNIIVNNILNVPKHLTPREICRTYNIPYLNKITGIFEKVYYGNKEPKKDDIKTYKKFLKSLKEGVDES